ncbi:HlyD family efflux transporter periplasmic adaptor subunit [Streptomyces europaeiscabiei]|uniref:HlyD family efflux transporter periplasmic adaptor subunit n=1 Tax=Streptomyces europaeiscabiei TaxID=146819 RepID=A0ABU4NJZ9_9ACTN|nr:HlyD family efflux transporter periplasmic adaptor subunit [Streptomyces europaeiscabiei]MDX2527459.1 HlyD family efflux transporter periplasmic adaptor subunit [Streptomyces europaeiscabiei]MDX2763410.1 HlyD family efflux transporter periplasmic adaptor subunit [Streptomyces europaeiscabiei]MDX2773116.1 HlyD family efflux transporter periplasmic adaptor subunit [Streptomyces europaeiscabiei]MDX3545953.1 HlyD family efflux transporter periplasmic adaptor subunit [Streptomyces europaeiscabiei
MQFRQQALAKLQSPEELDLPVRFARPQGWLVLSVTVVAMAAASVWAVTGSVASTVGAPAVLTHGQGSYVLQSPVAGQVTAVLARQGERLPARAPVLKVATTDGESVVRSVAAGRVSTLAATLGQIIRTGADVAAIEKVADADDPLYATVYVPAENAASIPEDAAVDLTVQSAPTQRYGVLRGHVKKVDRTAQTPQSIGAFLGDSQLGEQFTRKGRPVAVTVRLDRSASTESGYRWSSQDGPPFELTSMTMATGSIRLADERPVDWLLP